MPEFIDHVPSQSELEKWSADQKAIRDERTLDNFKFGYGYLEGEFADAISWIDANESLDDETKRQATEILAKGSLAGKELGHPDLNRNASGEWSQRTYLAKVLMSGQEGKDAVEAIADKGVSAFHSTRSQALAGMLETGALMSARALNEKGHTMVTGEHYYQKDGDGQDSISFSNLDYSREAALIHAGKQGVNVRNHATVIRDMEATIAELESLATENDQGKSSILTSAANRHRHAVAQIKADPESLLSALSVHEFPVMVGLSREYIDRTEEHRETGRLIAPGGSHLGEIRPVGESIPIEDLPVVAVPAKVVTPVRELFTMFGHLNTKVIAIEPLVA